MMKSWGERAANHGHFQAPMMSAAVSASRLHTSNYFCLSPAGQSVRPPNGKNQSGALDENNFHFIVFFPLCVSGQQQSQMALKQQQQQFLAISERLRKELPIISNNFTGRENQSAPRSHAATAAAAAAAATGRWVSFGDSRRD